MTDLQVPLLPSGSLTIALPPGGILFVVGANGTGKSNLQRHFYRSAQGPVVRILAHRRNWLEADGGDMTANQRAQMTETLLHHDRSARSVWRDDYSGHRAGLALFDLANTENRRNREIAAAAEARDETSMSLLIAKEGPVKSINRILRASNLPVSIKLAGDGTVAVNREGVTPYGISRLSDGERNAVLVAAEVLTAADGSLILVDEPERHLHRSISAPLLTQLFAERPDCSFVISTHDLDLTLEHRDAQVLVLRGVAFQNEEAIGWMADAVPADAPLDDDTRRAILGARRKLLFVEGAPHSLDLPLYALLFPMVAIVAKEGSPTVIHATTSLHDSAALHWVESFGIIDGDGRTPDEVADLGSKGVFALPAFTVESIYYDPALQRRVGEAVATLDGGNLAQRIGDAERLALEAISSQVERLSARRVEKSIRGRVLAAMPRLKDIRSGDMIASTIDTKAELDGEVAHLQELLRKRDLEAVIARYPVRETQLPDSVARALGFTGRQQYERAVRMLLSKNDEALVYVRSRFGALTAALGIT